MLKPEGTKLLLVAGGLVCCLEVDRQFRVAWSDIYTELLIEILGEIRTRSIHGQSGLSSARLINLESFLLFRSGASYDSDRLI